MTSTLEELAGARPEPPRDQWGRYEIPHPDTGQIMSWTRATTFASAIADEHNLTSWKMRMVAYGITHRDDLYAEAASITDPDAAKQQLGKLAGDALEHAGASSKARLGTAMHAFCEAQDTGRGDTIPEQYRADVAAYVAALEAAGVEIIGDYIERVITVPAYTVAGTFDRIVRVGRDLYVADLKTGRDLSYSWREIAVQLSLYARAQTIWDVATKQHSAMPEVNQDRALVIHLPIGKADCALHWVDLAAGRDASELCEQVRSWRKRKDLNTAYTTPTPPAPIGEPVHVSEPVAQVVSNLEARTDQWLAERIRALSGQPAAIHAVRVAWGDLPATPPWTPAQRTQIEAALSAGEAAIGAPFPAPRPVEPTPPPAPAVVTPQLRPRPDDDGAAVVDVTVCDALATRVRGLADPRVLQFRAWLTDGKTVGRMLHGMVEGKAWPHRTHATVLAMCTCLTDLWDDDDADALTRAALRVVIGGDEVHPTFPTGALLCSLTPDEARQLTQIAAAFGRSEPDVCAQLGATVA